MTQHTSGESSHAGEQASGQSSTAASQHSTQTTAAKSALTSGVRISKPVAITLGAVGVVGAIAAASFAAFGGNDEADVASPDETATAPVALDDNVAVALDAAKDPDELTRDAAGMLGVDPACYGYALNYPDGDKVQALTKYCQQLAKLSPAVVLDAEGYAQALEMKYASAHIAAGSPVRLARYARDIGFDESSATDVLDTTAAAGFFDFDAYYRDVAQAVLVNMPIHGKSEFARQVADFGVDEADYPAFAEAVPIDFIGAGAADVLTRGANFADVASAGGDGGAAEGDTAGYVNFTAVTDEQAVQYLLDLGFDQGTANQAVERARAYLAEASADIGGQRALAQKYALHKAYMQAIPYEVSLHKSRGVDEDYYDGDDESVIMIAANSNVLE